MNTQISSSFRSRASFCESPYEISIIIVHYNTPQLTLDCIASLRRHVQHIQYEVIVIDNASEQNIEQLLSPSESSVRVIRLSRNCGFAVAANVGMANAGGEFFFLLNSDTMLLENTPQAMLDHMLLNSEIGILGPRQIDKEGRFTPSCGKFPSLIREMIRKILHARLSSNNYRLRDYMDQKFSDLSHVDWVSGSCMMIRRKALFETGLFDERFFMYFEDIDLCKRVQAQGWKIVYYPNHTLLHYGGQSARLNIMNVLLANRRSQLYFCHKYYGIVGTSVLRFLLMIKYFFNLSKSFALHAFFRFTEKKRRQYFTHALISKKLLGLVMTPFSNDPLIPSLPASSLLGSTKK